MAAPSTGGHGGHGGGDRSPTCGEGSSTGGHGGGDRSPTGGGPSPAGGDPSSTGGESVEDGLLKAARDGDLARVKGIINGIGKESGPSFFSFKKDVYAGALHHAACHGHLEVCKYLVEELNIDPDLPASYGMNRMTPLMASAQSGDVATVKYFLDSGGDMLKQDENGFTVLHHAACSGSPSVTSLLISYQMPIDIDYGSGSPLFHAALRGRDKTLKILLDHGANPNGLFNNLIGPLMAALIRRSLKCMKLLIMAGADIDAKASIVSPLIFATERGGCTAFVQLLLSSGADPNIPNEWGRLPIELAAIRNCRAEVEILFPLTNPIPEVANWSVDGVLSHGKSRNVKRMVKSDLDHFTHRGTSNEQETIHTSSRSERSCSNGRKLCEMLGTLLQRIVSSISMVESLKGTVTLSLNGNAFKVLMNYIYAIVYFRFWNYLRGTCIDLSPLFGYEKKIYTAPPDGEFRFVVEYEGDQIPFLFDGRASWFCGWIVKDTAYEFKRESVKGEELQEKPQPYINHSNHKFLKFTGNYEDVAPDGSPGQIKIGLEDMRETFKTILGGQYKTEIQKLAPGTWVVRLGEASKFNIVFWYCCRSTLSKNFNTLDAYDKSIGLMVPEWGKLCLHTVKHLLRCLDGIEKFELHNKYPQIANRGVPGITSIKDVLDNVCLWTYGCPKGIYFKRAPRHVAVSSKEDSCSNDHDSTIQAMGEHGTIISSAQNHIVAKFIEKRRPVLFRASTWASELPLKHSGTLLSRSTIHPRPVSTWCAPLHRRTPLRTLMGNSRVLSTATTLLRFLKK